MRRTGSIRVIAVLSIAVAALTGCFDSSSDVQDPRPRASASAVTSPTDFATTNDATEAARADVLSAYQGYWAAQVQALADPEGRIPRALSRYAIDKARADVQETVVLFRQQGIVLTGQPRLAPKVTNVRLGDHPSASITDCVDSTKWTPVLAKTGESARAPGQKTRVVMESTAETYAGRWVIRTSLARRDRSC